MPRPLTDKVLVKPIAIGEQKSGSGLYMPEASDGLQRGEVVAVGPGYYSNGTFVKTEVQQGDVVLYPHFVGAEHKVDDVKHLFINASDLVAVDD